LVELHVVGQHRAQPVPVAAVEQGDISGDGRRRRPRRETGGPIDTLPDAPPVLGADGGTDFVLYRKDRVLCVQGGERLEAHRLKPERRHGA
jgi:hypothetical protein